MPVEDLHFLLILLKGRTDRIGRSSCKGRTDCNLAGGAIAVTVVIYAVLYVALDTFDVLGRIAVTLVIKLVIFHFHTSFHSFAWWQYYCCQRTKNYTASAEKG
jgi:hypothetical protein